MPQVAITDRRLCTGIYHANHALDKGDDFKIIYGVEGYLVDDFKAACGEFPQPEFCRYLWVL